MTDSNHSNTDSESANLEDEFAQLDAEEASFSAKDYRAEDWLALAAFALLALTVFAQFFTRYVLGSALGWTEEVARYLLICVTFLGASMAVRKHAHIAVTLFIRLLPARVANPLATFVDVLSALFLASLCFFAIQIIPRIHIYEMASLPLQLSVLYSVVFAGVGLMLFRAIKNIFTKRSTEQDAL